MALADDPTLADSARAAATQGLIASLFANNGGSLFGGAGMGGTNPLTQGVGEAGSLATAALPAAAGATPSPTAAAVGQAGRAGGGGGGGLMDTLGPAARYLGYANRAYQIGSQLYNGAQAGQLGQTIANLTAGTLLPAAATAIFSKAAQGLAKEGGGLGAGIGSAAGAALGLLGGPLAPLTVPLGALLGGTAGGQIGPNPTVGPNFAGVGTFNPDGTLTFSGHGGDNGGNAAAAQELTNLVQSQLPAYAASQGLVFNPAAAGRQITTGLYAGRDRGLFYNPGGNPVSPERWATFPGTENYLNTMLGDLAARGVFYRQGEAPPELNFDANIDIGALRHNSAPPGTFGHAAQRIMNIHAGSPDLSSWESIYNYGRGQIEAARQQAAADEAIRQRNAAWAAENNVPANPINFDAENMAAGGVVQLNGGGKLAIGPGGGLDDLIPTTIDGRRAAALSDGEFVVPADVVSMMGDGSSNEGSRRLYDLVKQIRQSKTGTSQQAGPLPVGDILRRTLS